MKTRILIIVSMLITTLAYSQANTSLSNLTSPTSVNQDLLPSANNTRSLGKSTLRWKNAFIDSLSISKNATINGITVGRGKGNSTYNTANGVSSLASNTTGSNNTATGYKSLFPNTTGANNTANGAYSLSSNTTGSNNTATGGSSLANNTTGYDNTAFGAISLRFNTTGWQNTASGMSSLKYNTTGNYNTANGYNSLGSNKTGYENTASGAYSLSSNTTGSGNTASGRGSLSSNTIGSNNTALSFYADVTTDSFSNAIVIGYYATVDASNKVRIGNSSVTSIGGQVSWTSFSDGRIKKNIKENVPGLRFINLLKPVTYNYDLAKEYALQGRTDSSNYEGKNDIEKINFTGFVAQEVDAAAKQIGYDFSGVDKTGKIMGLRYSDFVVPLVKAVQELSNQNDVLKNDNEEQKKINSELQQQIDELKLMMTQQTVTTTTNQSSTINNQSVTLSSSFILEQNIPNPFSNTTTINCSLPVNNGNAYINFYAQTGSLLKSVKITGEGKNTITVTANELAAGTYKYALVVDGKMIDTKMMVLQR